MSVFPGTPAEAFDALCRQPGSIEGIRVLAGPGERLADAPQPGDFLLSRMRGESDHGRMHVLTTGGLPDAAGLRSAGRGLYACAGEIAVRVADLAGALPLDQMLVRPEPAPDAIGCRPGEGPPGAEPDPTGRGLHPLIGRGTSPGRSRRPSVGFAQQCLNEFLRRHEAGEHTCADPTAAGIVRSAIDALRSAGEFPLRVDCRFGPNTERAARAFQACAGVTRDGVVGPVTWRLLEAFAPAAPPPPPPPPDIDDPLRRWRTILGPALRDGNLVEDLVDGPDTFRSMAAAVRTAVGEAHYIYLLGWWLDVDESLDVPVPPAPQCPPSPRAGMGTIRAQFRRASNAGVQVRAVLWDQPGTKNDAERTFINSLGNGAAVVDGHQISRTFGAHHQKVLVVKGSEGLVAFCGGIDINCDRVCPSGTCAPGGSGGSASGSSPGQPHHDVHCRIAGPAAHDLLSVFIKRWFSTREHVALDAAKGALRGLTEPVPPPAGRALVRIGETYNATATMPGGITRTFRDRTVQEILLAVIGSARRFIYIEDQYLIGMCAAEAIRRALPHVDHVTILISASELLPGLNLPRRWEFRKRFIDHIRTAPEAHKLRVFTLCTPGSPGTFGPHTYVHAKTLIADDEVAVIGSANVNRRGWEHDSEVVAAVIGPAADGTPLAQRLRTRLWVEHLGVPASAVADPVASKGLWTSAAGRRVCPYNPRGGTDPLLESLLDEDLIDPPSPLVTAPCCAIHAGSCPARPAAPVPPLLPPILAGA